MSVVPSLRAQETAGPSGSEERAVLATVQRLFDAMRGTLATVWAEYDFHFGQTPSHCGVDAVQLLKTPSGWKIVSIADTYEPTGCPKRDPPR